LVRQPGGHVSASGKWVASALAGLLVAGSAGASSTPSTTTTENTYLTAALRLYNDLEFSSALDQFRKAEKYSSGPSDDVVIHTYEGMIEFEDGKNQEAEADFKVALSLNLAAELPAGTSPKTRELWERVRGDLKAQRVALPPGATEAVDGGAPDAGAPDAGAPDGGELAPDLRAVPEVRAENGVTAKPPASPSPFAVPSSMPGFLVAGGGALLMIAGGVLGGIANATGNNAQSDQFQSDANNDLNTANQQAGISYALLGVGAVAIGGGTALLVMHYTQASAAPDPAPSPPAAQ
jgi:hypothetical protein